MKPEKPGNSDAEDQKREKTESIEDLSGARVPDKAADRVKGGFNPQPEPPGRRPAT